MVYAYMRRPRLIAVSILILIGGCAQTGANEIEIGNASAQKTVTYCGSQKMDITTPEFQNNIKPIVLYIHDIHGGGWESGSRKDGFERRRLKPLLENGFAVATLDYRLAPTHKHPAQILDVKCAIKYLRANSRSLNIDPDRIGLMGDSAGGHLSALVGLTSPKDGLEGTSLPGVSSNVKAVATFYGLFDVVNVKSDSLAVHAVAQNFRNRAEKVQGSPIIYVDKNDPPFLIMHGKEDRFVDVAQSVKLALMLKDLGHDPLLVAVENAGHGFVNRTGKPDPDNQTLDKLVVAFFTEHLKN